MGPRGGGGGRDVPSGAQHGLGSNGFISTSANAQQRKNSHEQDEEYEDRPKTELEKELQKLRKKMREIERIEDKLRIGEKVDPLQLQKLEKKIEIKYYMDRTEAKVREETKERQAELDPVKFPLSMEQSKL